MPFFSIPTLPPITIKVLAEGRERFERRLNKDFDVSVPDNRSDLLSRWRVGVKLGFGPAWKVEVQYQNAHDLIWTKAKNWSTQNSDISLAYVENAAKGWTVDLGRQKINIGQQRLIGSFEWNNVGRSFDAVRVRSRTWDAFAFRVGLASPLPAKALGGGLLHSNASYGDTLYVYKHDETSSGDVDIHTLDHSWTHKVGTVAVDTEGALQFGKSQNKDQRAWAIHLRGAWSAGHGFTPFLEVNSASGGSTATENRTFDNLYPTNHGKYGLADMTGWKNMNHLAVGTEFAARKDLTLKLSWNAFGLRDGRDAWYGASGAANTHNGTALKDPTGASGKDLGNEFDLDGAWSIGKTRTLSFGVAVFNPGDFVANVTGHRDRQVWGYAQFTARF